MIRARDHRANRVLIVHPSAELYGSDRVALESVGALVADGWEARTTLTVDGPLVELLEQAGSQVTLASAPVLRRSALSPLGLIRLVGATVRYTPAMLRLLRTAQADVVYVSTIITPWWLVLARLSGARVVCHLHEAEEAVPRLVQKLLATPMLFAHAILANSEASRNIVVRALPLLGKRTRIVFNGVVGPKRDRPGRERLEEPIRLVLIGRISPRKGTDVAVEALRLLSDRGIKVELDLVGGIFPGYEWFESQVRAAAQELGVAHQVRWLGVMPDVWSAIFAADIALVPSRVEPFGNVAVEAMLAGRPVIVSDTQGLKEIVRSGENGISIPPGDAAALADAVHHTIRNWQEARQRAELARSESLEKYSTERYRSEVIKIMREVTGAK